MTARRGTHGEVGTKDSGRPIAGSIAWSGADRAHGWIIAAAVLGVALSAGRPRAQQFDCVHLNDDNTNIFVTPDECFLFEEHQIWCDCASSLFTNPVKGQKSGFNQAVQWILDQPGIGNHRVEVSSGTLDLSGLQVGDQIGETVLHELIPQSVGVPPNAYFTVRSRVRVTAVQPDAIDFSIVVPDMATDPTAVSTWAILILTYDPRGACHSNGVQYKGTLRSKGPDQGFVLEYRYPKDLIVEQNSCFNADHSAYQHPAIDPTDADSPGFTVRFLMKFFTTESAIYTLPTTASIAVDTTLRRFTFQGETSPSLDEILDLGAEDLCVVRDAPEADQNPCKEMAETLQLKNDAGENSSPTARIVMLDPFNVTRVDDPAIIDLLCGEARLILRGGNSDDGDGGTQTISYHWLVKEGPEGGAAIPESTVDFKDTEVSFTLPGHYVIGLQIDDGGAENNTDETTVVINVNPGLDVNTPPTAVVKTEPDPPVLELVDGKAVLRLDGGDSSNGTPGIDDCMQSLSYVWRLVGGPPGGATIQAAEGEETLVDFTLPGSYDFELEVDDGAPEDNTATADVTVTVTGEPAKTRFRRGDSDANGKLEITDAIRTLGWLFSGGIEPSCLDAADSDDSGRIDISDPIKALNYLFLGSGPPEPPGPDVCGEDVRPDELAECVYEKC
jgi:hypothetical protein